MDVQSVFLLLKNYHCYCILLDALLIFATSPSVISLVSCTAAQVPRYYNGLLIWNRICYFQICKSQQSDTRRPDCLYHRQPRCLHGTTSDLATALSHSNHMLPSRCPCGFKDPSFKTTSLNLPLRTVKRGSRSLWNER